MRAAHFVSRIFDIICKLSLNMNLAASKRKCVHIVTAHLLLSRKISCDHFGKCAGEITSFIKARLLTYLRLR